MIFGSICSGIEAASVAWHPLGWRASFFSEIEKFPRVVLARRWPVVPVHGDFTTINAGDYDPIDLLVGGTPCQAFSVAGLRQGFADERGSLTLEFVRLAQRLKPRWLVWENVPGVLSIDEGRAFGAFLGRLAELGYGFAYRILDAQHFGVPQRRRRVFVVGHLGDWRRAAAVLFERESLLGNPPPRREAGQSVAGTIAAGAHPSGFNWRDAERGNVVHSLRADGFDASEDGTGRGTPLVTIAIQGAASRENPNSGPDGVGVRTDGVAFSAKDHGGDAGDLSPTLRAGGFDKSHANAGVTPAIAVRLNATCDTFDDATGALTGIGGTGNSQAVTSSMSVRRLTPRECERLQGFPDDYTLVTYRGKPAADGPRYKALGNSMAVPCMRWIGERIVLIENLVREAA